MAQELFEPNVGEQNVEELYTQLKLKRDKASILQRRYFVQGLILAKKYHKFGINRKYLQKCKMNKFEMTSKRSDAMSPETIDHIQHFYLRPDVSVELPTKKTVSKTTMRQKHILDKSLDAVHEQFRQENPSVKVSLSKFSKLRPKHVLKVNQTQLNQCLCEYCTNIELKLRSLNMYVQNHSLNGLRVKDKYHCTRLTMCLKGSKAFNDLACIERRCTVCGVTLLQQHYKVIIDCVEQSAVATKRDRFQR